jgi:hypothetical protein
MFNALGLVSIKPKIYTSVDYMRFCSIIDELDSVIKDELPPFEVVTSGDENKGKGKYYDQALSFDNDRFSDLVQEGISHNYVDNVGKYALFNIYCPTQKESTKAKKIMDRYGAKYFVSESKTLY